MFLSFAFSPALAALLLQSANAQPGARRDMLPCSNVTMLVAQPQSALPSLLQQQILSALSPSILSFAKATAEDLEEDLRLHKIVLNAIQIPRTGTSEPLYLVHWGLREFGVNEAVWIVEVNAHAARNLIAPGDQRVGKQALSGWGFQVLSVQDEKYPEIMIASKGFTRSGLPEAEAECVRKDANSYRPTPCAADCSRDLNSR
jgi:hypothetical protein